jgi:hypothetical protein
MFVGHDSMRPILSQVSLKDGYLYATDGIILAKIKAELCCKTYVEVEKYPNAETVVSDHKSIEKKTVSVDQLFNELMKIEVCFKPKMIECSDCDGDGASICGCCGNEGDCNTCNGDGEVPGKELELTGAESRCSLFNKDYGLPFIDTIIKTAVYTGVKEIEISNAEGTRGTLFTVGDFTILLMPKTRN